jgi:hypothetical protein
MIKSGDDHSQVSTLEMVNGKAALVTTPQIKGRRTISTADLRAAELFYCNSGIVYHNILPIFIVIFLGLLFWFVFF